MKAISVTIPAWFALIGAFLGGLCVGAAGSFIASLSYGRRVQAQKKQEAVAFWETMTKIGKPEPPKAE